MKSREEEGYYKTFREEDLLHKYCNLETIEALYKFAYEGLASCEGNCGQGASWIYVPKPCTT